MEWLYCVLGCSLLALHLFFWWLSTAKRPARIQLESARVLVTGGSSGIGYAVSKALLEAGVREVVIAARGEEKLRSASRQLVQQTGRDGAVSVLPVDVGSPDSVDVIRSVAEDLGGFDVVVMSAGVSQPGRFAELPVKPFEDVMRVNYLGSVHTAKAVIPQMQMQQSGRLMFVSSLAGLAGVGGLACYNASKFAVRGLAETLCMELNPFGIGVTLINPPDVDTPMLARENEVKPEECKIMSADASLFTPEQVAADVVAAIKSYRFMVNTGFDGKLLGVLAASITTPVDSVWQVWIEFLSSSILRVVGLFYLKSWNATTARVYHKERLVGGNKRD